MSKESTYDDDAKASLPGPPIPGAAASTAARKHATPYGDSGGGPAFPSDQKNEHDCVHLKRFSGMTLRDYFAAKAMQAILSAPDEVPLENETHERSYSDTALSAYQVADAMLAARESFPAATGRKDDESPGTEGGGRG